MPEAPNAPNAVQPSNRTRTWQADGSGCYSVKKPSQVWRGTDTVEDVQAFVDLVEYTRPATDNQL